jgi:hypothetical protein
MKAETVLPLSPQVNDSSDGIEAGEPAHCASSVPAHR